jgi:hypothetical protein
MEEQDDFDNLYSSKLPNFANNDWRALEGQLERHDLKRQLRKLMWALPAVGGIMLAVSSVLYYQLNRTREQVKTLEYKLVNAYNQRQIQPDVSPQKIFIHDTIYKQVIIRQVVQENSYKKPTLTNNQDNIYYEKYGENSTENQIITEREKFIGIHKLSGKNPVLSATNIGVTNDFAKYKGESFPEDSVVEENHFSLIPKSVSVGILVGALKPMGEDFENGGGHDIGFRAVLGYHNRQGLERWGVVLDFQQSNLYFDNDKRERLGHFGAPPNPKPSTNLKRIEVPEFSFYNIGLGLRYNLLFNEKFKPYFGMNWNIQLPNQYNIDYQYEDLSKVSNTNISVSTMHLLGLNLGANLAISKRLIATGEMYYKSQLSSNSSSNQNPFNGTLPAQAILGGRVGISYRFGI